jgi:hypothetical protein
MGLGAAGSTSEVYSVLLHSSFNQVSHACLCCFFAGLECLLSVGRRGIYQERVRQEAQPNVVSHEKTTDTLPIRFAWAGLVSSD